MALFLVDFENVKGTDAFNGADLLTPDDTVCIFYSKEAFRLKAYEYEALQRSGCKIEYYKLIKGGKNALDFYIVGKASSELHKKCDAIGIISNDSGYDTFVDYISNYEGIDKKVVKCSGTIRKVLSVMSTDALGRAGEANRSLQAISIDTLANQATALKVKADEVREVLKEYLEEQNCSIDDYTGSFIQDMWTVPLKEVYSKSLQTFGKDNGIEVHYMVKEYKRLKEEKGDLDLSKLSNIIQK